MNESENESEVSAEMATMTGGADWLRRGGCLTAHNGGESGRRGRMDYPRRRRRNGRAGLVGKAKLPSRAERRQTDSPDGLDSWLPHELRWMVALWPLALFGASRLFPVVCIPPWPCAYRK